MMGLENLRGLAELDGPLNLGAVGLVGPNFEGRELRTLARGCEGNSGWEVCSDLSECLALYYQDDCFEDL